MKKRKRRCEPQAGAAAAEEDRLSELPESVLFLILSFVPMIDVVRTTILSKRWRNLWTTTPFLNFDYDSHSRSIDHYYWRRRRSRSHLYGGGFERWVNHFLFRWNGVRILELKVSSYFDSLMSREMELWVDFAIAKGVENLYLRDGRRGEECWVPHCLFSCSSLKLLTIKNCKWRIDGIVQWNKLKQLKITKGREMTEALISQLLCGSPLLEVFELSFLDKGQNLNIRSNSLKELTIHKHLYDNDDFDSEFISLVSVSELTIWTPKLETLRIIGIPFGKYGLIHVPSATRVTIGLSDLFSCEGDTCIADDFFRDRFDQILQIVQHVERVELICDCIEVLGMEENKYYMYSKVKSLVVKYRLSNDYEAFLGPLKLFSQLSRLVLQWYQCEDMDFPSFRAANLPKSFRLQLRTVDITWSKGDDDDEDHDDNIFPFVEFLLKYSDKLEKMVFRSFMDDSSLASRELLRMPRSSPNCRICLLNN